MQSETLVQGLLEPAAYPHPSGPIRLVETHCAWVFLTGEFAYKVKKPVNFGFLDFSTLAQRRFYCAEEIRLNRRFAPQIYLEVVAIGGTPLQPRVGATGPAQEYAVRMRQFADGCLLSQLAERGRLDNSLIDQLVGVVGEFHRTAERSPPDSIYGSPDQIHHWVQENFQHIRSALTDAEDEDVDPLERLRLWSEQERTRIDPLLRQRKQDGFIRECHGDLHLGNITVINAEVTPFDCIEFNPELRWIDVLSEVAFLTMDLDDRDYSDFANHFLNGYLQITGDYAGLGVLRYYRVYRALVRAKVAMLRRAQTVPGSEPFRQATADYHQYAQLATGYLSPRPAALLITQGLSGSGKSTLARQLCERAGMIQIRSDIERKRLAGLAAGDSSHSDIGAGLYAATQTQQTYRHLAALAARVLQAGYRVIIDATFLQRAQRNEFGKLAAALGVPFIILHCAAENTELERRILARVEAGHDASEAGLEVLHAQQQADEPLQPDELSHTLRIDTQAADLDRLQVDVDRLCRLQASDEAQH